MQPLKNDLPVDMYHKPCALFIDIQQLHCGMQMSNPIMVEMMTNSHGQGQQQNHRNEKAQ